MNPITDTAMLKHHRVDYGTRTETDGMRRSVNAGRPVALIMITLLAMIPLGFLAGLAG